MATGTSYQLVSMIAMQRHIVEISGESEVAIGSLRIAILAFYDPLNR